MSKQRVKAGDTSSYSLPHNIAAEKAVIGMLLMESTAINEVMSILEPDMFYDANLSTVYSAVRSITDRGDKIDMLSVTRELICIGKLEEIGGPYLISELTMNVASSINIADHARYIHQLYLARKLAVTGQAITARALDQTNDIEEVISESLNEVENVAAKTCYNVNFVSVGEAARRSIERYSEREERVRKGVKLGVPTGLGRLDKCTGGFKPQEVIVLAARPAMGKTAYMLHMAKTAAAYGIPVAVFSLEMSEESLTDRLMVSEMPLNPDRFKNGYLSNEEKPIMCTAADRLSSLPISIDDTAGLSIQQIKARARNLQRKGKCGMVMIDYLQLIEMGGGKGYNRENEVRDCSQAVKRMAKELNIPVVILSQLSREVEKREDKIPRLADLRESGAIEQDADIVIFLHRPEYYDIGEEKGKGIIRLAKQRNGDTGDFIFRYNENLSRFGDEGEKLEMPF